MRYVFILFQSINALVVPEMPPTEHLTSPKSARSIKAIPTIIIRRDVRTG